MKLISPASSERHGLENNICKSDFNTIASEIALVSEQTESNKSVISTFDENTFLVTKISGAHHNSIGLNRHEMAQLFPKIREFLA